MDEKTKRLLTLIKNAKEEHSGDNFIYAVPQFMSKKFTSYCSIREDLKSIKEFLQRCKDGKDKLINASLTYSSISLYGKSFTDATKNKAPKLEPNEVFKDSPEQRAVHDYLMHLRHNFVAHRGDSENEVNAAYLLVPKQDGEPQVRFAQLTQLKFDNSRIGEIINLLDFLLEVVETKIQKSGDKVFDAFLKNFTPEQANLMRIDNMIEE